MRKILIPTDFSAIAVNASEYALAIAKTLKGELVFFHADEHTDSNEHNKLIAEVNKISTENPSLKTSFVATDKLFNSLTINDLFKDSLGLIIIGTSGESGDLSKKIFGTNTSEITEDMNCPVIAIPSDYKYTDIRKIGYASDLNNLDKEITEVIDFSRKFNAVIEVFHVSPVFPDLGDVEKIDIQSKIEELKQKHGYSAIQYFVEKTNHDNQINKGINNFLSHHNSDLLVLFHNIRSGIDRFITSSETRDVITHIKTPLLIFPKAY